MKTFTKGFAAGASALAVAVPLMAQMALAASGDETSSGASDAANRSVPSQACTEAMADLASAHLDVFDEMSAQRKAKMQAHRDALVAAASIADDEQRREALRPAREDMRPDEKPEPPAAVAAAMEAVRAACGDTMALKGGRGPMGGHGGPGMMKMKRFGRGTAETAPLE